MAWAVMGAAIVLVSISWLVVRTMRTRPYLFVGWFWFLGTLVPVIGIVPVGAQAMAAEGVQRSDRGIAQPPCPALIGAT